MTKSIRTWLVRLNGSAAQKSHSLIPRQNYLPFPSQKEYPLYAFMATPNNGNDTIQIFFGQLCS